MANLLQALNDSAKKRRKAFSGMGPIKEKNGLGGKGDALRGGGLQPASGPLGAIKLKILNPRNGKKKLGAI